VYTLTVPSALKSGANVRLISQSVITAVYYNQW
jgi:hypothetical protein